MRNLFSGALLGLAVAGCGPSTNTPPSASPVVPVTTATSVQQTAKKDAPEDGELAAAPVVSASSIDRYAQRFDDAMAKDKGDRNGPTVSKLRDVIVPPLVQACVEGDFDPKTRSKIVRLVSNTQDARGVPCFIKTLEKYVPDETDADVRLAARAVGSWKTKDAAAPLFEAFRKVHPGKPNGALIYREVNEAVVAIADPAWESPCISMISGPIRDRKDMETFKLELYRQVTCAQVLGQLKSAKAVPYLARIMLSPIKAAIQSTALNALIHIGKPAISSLVAILQGTDKALVEYAKLEYIRANAENPDSLSVEATKAASKAHIQPVAVMLGSIGHGDAAAPMLDALGKADPKEKVAIARELLKLPYTPAMIDAVKRVYEKTPHDLTIPPGLNGRSAMLDQMAFTFDAQLVPWIVKDALAQKAPDADLEEVREDALIVAIKLAKFDQWATVDKLARLPARGGMPISQGFVRELQATKSLLTECRENLACYFDKLADPNMHADDQQFIGVKCAYMIGVLGGPEVRGKLVELLPSIQGPAARFVAVQVIDHHSPKGDVAIARQLEKIYEDALATKNPGKLADVSYFKQFVSRLEARVQ